MKIKAIISVMLACTAAVLCFSCTPAKTPEDSNGSSAVTEHLTANENDATQALQTGYEDTGAAVTGSEATEPSATETAAEDPTEESDEYFIYTKRSDGTYGISAKDKNNLPTNLVIPSSHNGIPVTNIEFYGFSDCSGITSVDTGDGLTNLSNSAFRGCTNLTNVKIGKNITLIAPYAFQKCAISEISIPETVTKICVDAFADCNNLKYTIVDEIYYLGNESNPYYALIRTYNKTRTSFEIHKDTKLIADHSCQSLSNIETIIIPDGVLYIGHRAFEGASKLKSIKFPDSLIHVEGSLFNGANSLRYNEYENGLYLGNDNNPYLVFIKARSTDITGINISEQTKIIAGYAFQTNANLTSVVLPEGVKTIGYGAFQNCKNLTDITIPASVTMMGSYAIYSSANITDIHYGGTVEQWKTILKASSWDGETGNYTVHCTDGDIQKG